MTEKIYTFPANNDPLICFNIIMAGYIYARGSKKEYLKRTNYPNYVIEYITKGRGYLQIAEKSYSVQAGDLYILHKGLDHEFYPEMRDPWHKVFIIVSGKLVETLINVLGLRNVYYIKDFKYGMVLDNIISTAIKSRGEVHIRTVPIFVDLLTRIVSSVNIVHQKRFSEPVSDLKDYIDSNVEKRFTVSELAQKIFRSSSQMNRIFKKETGFTPYDYVLLKKIETAQLLLMNTTINVKQIAYKLGFEDEYYFSNIFKKKAGLSPLNYRLKHRST